MNLLFAIVYNTFTQFTEQEGDCSEDEQCASDRCCSSSKCKPKKSKALQIIKESNLLIDVRRNFISPDREAL